jgi:DNA topoisomerase-1
MSMPLDVAETSKPTTRRPLDVPASATALAKRLGLRHVRSTALTIRRRRQGKGWIYLNADGRQIRDPTMIKRLAGLAVPPAYRDVLYAEDASAHLQAIGRDDAGRLQYRYHPEWEKVREIRKARRLARLADVLPRIRRSVAQYLAADAPTREFAFAAVIELVARSAIRPGRESYLRRHGTRGAATLLKSNVSVSGDTITLTFRAKGGKNVVKQFSAPRFIAAIAMLQKLPGRRLFQYRTETGEVRAVRARDVNTFLREIAGAQISLKDFRTLLASASVFESLAGIEPATTERKRRRQVRDAVRDVADELSNTPAICRKSYVHATVVDAFEDGALERFAEHVKQCRSDTKRAQLLAQVIVSALR